jgi:hypothetical protein
MLTEDTPTFANWNQDETAIKERYSEQDPEVVADELEAAAQRFVSARIQSYAEQYDRRGSGSDGAEFTVVTFLQYFLHDVIHICGTSLVSRTPQLPSPGVAGRAGGAQSVCQCQRDSLRRSRSARQRSSRSSSSASAHQVRRFRQKGLATLADIGNQKCELAALAGVSSYMLITCAISVEGEAEAACRAG